MDIGFGGPHSLVNKDLTPKAAGLAFSVGAHCLGPARHLRTRYDVPGYETFFFRRGREVVVAFDNNGKAPLLFGAQVTVSLGKMQPLPGTLVTLTDLLGRSSPVQIKNGRATLLLKGTAILNGLKSPPEITGRAVNPGQPAIPGIIVAEAVTGTRSARWAAVNHERFSGGQSLDIFTEAEPVSPDEGYWVKVPFPVPDQGNYTVLFSGNDLERLKPEANPSLSPFDWYIDGTFQGRGSDSTPCSRENLIPGAAEGLANLGTVSLAAGTHEFLLRLTGRRNVYDNRYALWFNAMAFVKR